MKIPEKINALAELAAAKYTDRNASSFLEHRATFLKGFLLATAWHNVFEGDIPEPFKTVLVKDATQENCYATIHRDGSGWEFSNPPYGHKLKFAGEVTHWRYIEYDDF